MSSIPPTRTTTRRRSARASSTCSDALGRVSGPAAGTGVAEAAARVAAVDLDAPLGEYGGGAGRAVARVARRRGLVPRADVRRPPQLPGRASRPCSPSCSSRRSTPRSTPSTRASAAPSSSGTSSTGPRGRIGFGAGRRRRLHQRRHPVQPAGAAAGPRRRAADAATPLGRLRILASADEPLQRRRSRPACSGLGDDAVVPVPDRRAAPDGPGRARHGRSSACVGARPASRWRSSRRPARPTSARSTRCPTIADAVRALTTPGCTSTRRTAAGCSSRAATGTGSPASSRADSVTVDYHKTFFQPVSSSALIVRDGAPTWRHVTWHADYLNPEGTASVAQPGRQEPADHAPLRRAQAVDDPADDGPRRDRRVRRRRGRPRPATVHARVSDEPDLEVAARAGAEHAGASATARPGRHSRRRDAAQHAASGPRSSTSGRRWSPPRRSTAASWLKLTLLNPLATVDDIVGVIDLVRETGASVAACEPVGALAVAVSPRLIACTTSSPSASGRSTSAWPA